MRGVLVIDKPAGYTSFDVIARLKGMLKMKRIGHGGTLDPNATGVLPVFVGDAARLIDYLPDSDKTYEAEMTLGTATDTEDIWGTVLETAEVRLEEAAVSEAVLSFEGPYEQVPPMYSAKKVGGKKLYEYARQGIELERKPVSLQIRKIEVMEIKLPAVRFRVSCSKGTYIRTLCTDIGKKLGVPACMSALRRVRHGRFSLDQALSLEEVERAAKEGRAESLLIPVEQLFDCPEARVREDSLKKLLNGNRLAEADLTPAVFSEKPAGGDRPELLKVRDTEGVFKGLYRWDPEKNSYGPEMMFLN